MHGVNNLPSLQLGTEWFDCTLLVRDAGAYDQKIDGLDQGMIDKFVGHYGFNTGEDCIWFDNKEKKLFGTSQYRHGPAGKDHHFLDSVGKFLSGPWGRKMVNSKVGPDKSKELGTKLYRGDSESVYSFNDSTPQVIGKDVLVICGGPSVDDVSWEKIHYDYIFTCNEYYLNQKVVNSKIDLVAVTNLVDLGPSSEFSSYVTKDNVQVYFELERGEKDSEYNDMYDFAKRNPEISHYYQTRYSSAIGIGPRLVVLAMLMGAKNVYVVGLDGRNDDESSGDLMHAFNGDKPMPSWYRMFGSRFQDRHFVLFWEYIYSLQDKLGCRVFNLGENMDYNISGPLTREWFKWNEKIKASLI